jgi:hypothetical protein
MDVSQKLDGFDTYMIKAVKDWNAPGVAVGIVVNDKLVFSKGYGYRDYGNKLPFTPKTVCPIASNTKLFTAIAAGMLVDEGKLTWDKPVRDSVSSTRFYNDQLSDMVTLRDMLSHRTGIAYHHGNLPGFHSEVSLMPQDHIGVIVFVIGDHCEPLTNVVTYNVYERLLGMDLTPWSERRLQMRLEDKHAGTLARAKAIVGQVPNTKPSHDLSDYVGDYESPAYGILKIGLKDIALQFDFHTVRFAMAHFHYDRFDTPDDEQEGRYSVNFRTNPQGDVDQAVMSLDEAEVVFTRKPAAIDPKLLSLLPGTYETPNGLKVYVVANGTSDLSIVVPGQPSDP